MMRSFGLKPVAVPRTALTRMAELQSSFHKLYAGAARDAEFMHSTFDRMSARCAWTRRELAVYDRVASHANSKPLLLLPNSVYLQPAATGVNPVCSCSNVQAGEPYQLQLVHDLQSSEHEGVRPGPLRAACSAIAKAARLVHPSRPCVALLAKPQDRMALRTRIDLRGVGERLRRDHEIHTILYVSMADLARTRLDGSGDLILDGQRISVIYSRYDFSHPWGRWVDPIPAESGSAPTEELLAEWPAIERMELSNAIISSNLGCRLAHRRGAQHAYVRGGDLERLLPAPEAAALRSVLPQQWSLDPELGDGSEEREARRRIAEAPEAYVAKNVLRPRTGSGVTQDRLASGGAILTRPEELQQLAASPTRSCFLLFEKIVSRTHAAAIVHNGAMEELAAGEGASEVAAFGCYLDDGNGHALVDELAGFGARTRPVSGAHPLARGLGYGALNAVQDCEAAQVAAA